VKPTDLFRWCEYCFLNSGETEEEKREENNRCDNHFFHIVLKKGKNGKKLYFIHNEKEKNYTLYTIKNAMGINLDKLPLTDGKIHFIRKVDNKAGINVLNEVFEVGKAFISEYVWATICLGKRKMGVYYRAQDWNAPALIKEFEYDVMTLT
jgi:ssDNA-binding Zn-finger/Zn-ribbon topoisomerase 1